MTNPRPTENGAEPGYWKDYPSTDDLDPETRKALTKTQRDEIQGSQKEWETYISEYEESREEKKQLRQSD